MKKLLLASCLLAWAWGLCAQNYDFKPRETWPYLLEEFTSGGVHTSGGANLNEGWYNICVVDGKLHYVNGGKIMVADMRQVQYVRIGESMYVNRSGHMEKVLAEEGSCMLLCSTLVDTDRLAKTDIGYGVSSATASAQSVSNLGLAGATVNMELEAAIADSRLGSVLPLRTKYSFLLGGRQIDATRYDVLALPGIDKNAAKAFIKQEKINWNKPESLEKMLGFLAGNKY